MCLFGFLVFFLLDESRRREDIVGRERKREGEGEKSLRWARKVLYADVEWSRRHTNAKQTSDGERERVNKRPSDKQDVAQMRLDKPLK